MSKHIFLMALFAAYQIMPSGCTTTSSIASVDTLKQKVEFQSTTDNRTAMPNLRANPRTTKTIERLKAELKESPNNVATLLNLAQIYLMMEQYKESEQYCRQALRVELKNEEAKKILAQIYYRKENFDMAEIILNGIGGIKSKDSKVLNLLGMIAIHDHRNGEAMDYFKTALKINPNDVAVRMNLGVLYLKYRQLANAAIEFERVLRIMPDHDDAKLHLAIVKTARGDFKTAESIYGEILDKRSNNPLALYNLAVMEKNRKNYNNAIEVLKRYLATNHAKKQQNEEVFALIEDIRKRQQAIAESKVSDDEIQAMAEKEVAADTTSNAVEAKEEKAAPAAAPKATPPKDEEISDLEKLLQ